MTKIADLLASGRTLSFEFFPPPSDQAMRALEKALDELADLSPSFVSVTYGAGGTTRDRTREVVVGINANRQFPAMAHLTCVGHSRAEIASLLDDYAASDVHNILALAGDPPASGEAPGGDFRYAVELVEFVRSHGDFSVGVSAFPEVHPRSRDRASDRRHLADKLRMADFAITQFFFTAADYFALVNDLADLGVHTPVVPGVIPVLNPARVRRFAEMNGTAIPEAFFARLEAYPDEVDRLALAVDQAADLSAELLAGGVPGIHYYALNRAEAVVPIVRRLGAW